MEPFQGWEGPLERGREPGQGRWWRAPPGTSGQQTCTEDNRDLLDVVWLWGTNLLSSVPALAETPPVSWLSAGGYCIDLRCLRVNTTVVLVVKIQSVYQSYDSQPSEQSRLSDGPDVCLWSPQCPVPPLASSPRCWGQSSHLSRPLHTGQPLPLSWSFILDFHISVYTFYLSGLK